jgi:hypothetical protein
MIFSENRCPLFRIMLEYACAGPLEWRGNRQRNDSGRARNPRPRNLGDGNSLHLFWVRNFGHGRVGLASNAKGQPREEQDDQDDAPEGKLIDTVEQDNAERGPGRQRRHADGKVDQDVRRNVVA